MNPFQLVGSEKKKKSVTKKSEITIRREEMSLDSGGASLAEIGLCMEED